MKAFCRVTLLCVCFSFVAVYSVDAQLILGIDFSAAQGYKDGPLVGQPAGAATKWIDGNPGDPADTFAVSNGAMVITPIGGANKWAYITFPVQSKGTLIVSWDWQYVGPEDSNVDIGFNVSDTENFGFDGNPALNWPEQGAMCRMQQDSNVIDVRNGNWEGGGSYQALQEFSYTDGKLVSMRYEINLDEQTYDCYAQKEGETEILLADGFGFRREMIAGLDSLTMWDDGTAATSSVIVDNIVVAGPASVGNWELH
jgi:hypothetical protein